MIENLLQFKLNLDHYAKVVVPKEHSNHVRKIALLLHKGIVDGSEAGPATPVATGWARANWGVHIGRAGIPTDPMGKRPADGAPPMSSKTYFDPTTIVAMTPPFPFIWIYNNVSYIEALENGHSKQAPLGMVEHALNNLQLYVDKI